MEDLKIKINNNFFADTKNGLIEVESLAQSTGQPQDIWFGAIANSGSATILDYKKEILHGIQDGTLDYNNSPVVVIINGKTIRKHIINNSDYGQDNTFNIEMTNSIEQLNSIIYEGYVNESGATLYDIVLDAFAKIENFNFEPIEEQIMGRLQSITYYPAFVPSSSVKEFIDKVCEVALVCFVEKENGNFAFVDMTNSIGNSNIIRIPNKFQYPNISKDIIVKNQVNKVEWQEYVFGTQYNTLLVSQVNYYNYKDNLKNLGVENQPAGENQSAQGLEITREEHSYDLDTHIFSIVDREQKVKRFGFNFELPKTTKTVDNSLTVQNITLQGKTYNSFSVIDEEDAQYVSRSKFVAEFSSQTEPTFNYKTSLLSLDHPNENANEISGHYGIKVDTSFYTEISNENPTSLAGINYSYTVNNSTGKFIIEGYIELPVLDFMCNLVYNTVTKNSNFSGSFLRIYDAVTISINGDKYILNLVDEKKEEGNGDQIYSLRQNELIQQNAGLEKVITPELHTATQSGTITGRAPVVYLADNAQIITAVLNNRDYNFVYSYTSENESQITNAYNLGDVSRDETLNAYVPVRNRTPYYTITITPPVIERKSLGSFIAEKIIEKYENGLSAAKITVPFVDYYNTDGTLAISKSNGEMFSLNDIVVVDKDNMGTPRWTYADGSSMYWKVTGINIRKKGVVYIDLELQEVK